MRLLGSVAANRDGNHLASDHAPPAPPSPMAYEAVPGGMGAAPGSNALVHFARHMAPLLAWRCRLDKMASERHTIRLDERTLARCGVNLRSEHCFKFEIGGSEGWPGNLQLVH